MLVSSIGYFRGTDNNKNIHPIVNKGLQNQVEIQNNNALKDFYNAIKSAFSSDAKIAQRCLDMIA